MELSTHAKQAIRRYSLGFPVDDPLNKSFWPLDKKTCCGDLP